MTRRMIQQTTTKKKNYSYHSPGLMPIAEHLFLFTFSLDLSLARSMAWHPVSWKGMLPLTLWLDTPPSIQYTTVWPMPCCLDPTKRSNELCSNIRMMKNDSKIEPTILSHWLLLEDWQDKSNTWQVTMSKRSWDFPTIHSKSTGELPYPRQWQSDPFFGPFHPVRLDLSHLNMAKNSWPKLSHGLRETSMTRHG